jgi:hypothetical protein
MTDGAVARALSAAGATVAAVAALEAGRQLRAAGMQADAGADADARVEAATAQMRAALLLLAALQAPGHGPQVEAVCADRAVRCALLQAHMNLCSATAQDTLGGGGWAVMTSSDAAWGGMGAGGGLQVLPAELEASPLWARMRCSAESVQGTVRQRVRRLRRGRASVAIEQCVRGGVVRARNRRRELERLAAEAERKRRGEAAVSIQRVTRGYVSRAGRQPAMKVDEAAEEAQEQAAPRRRASRKPSMSAVMAAVRLGGSSRRATRRVTVGPGGFAGRAGELAALAAAGSPKRRPSDDSAARASSGRKAPGSPPKSGGGRRVGGPRHNSTGAVPANLSGFAPLAEAGAAEEGQGQEGKQ